jgi:uncharacterized membrane protein
MLHQRAPIQLTDTIVLKTTYPVLPWIGVIVLGHVVGPWFGRDTDAAQRVRRMALLGLGLVLGFVLLRYLNIYGDKPWFHAATPLRTVMSFLALTKYPPSLLFLMPTVGVGCLLLAGFEKLGQHPVVPHLACLGGAPMFYYVLHLYTLKVIYNIALAIYGPTKGKVFGVDNLSTVWIWVAVLILPLYFPTRWFAGLKQRRRDIAWLKYF